MYRNILPYSSHRDQSSVQGHHDTVGNAYANHLRRLRRLPSYPLARAVHSGAQRVRSALRRSAAARSARTSMSWWH